ncbi:carbohydrate-binding family 9-like protein [Candidatus Latescibacterota bacterium]
MKNIVLICAILFLCSLTASAADGQQSHTAKRASGAIYIDGNASEEDWSTAGPAGEFVFPWHESGEKEQTDVRILWDDEYLYVLFRCEDTNISAHYFQRNIAVSRDDCVEVFIAPNADNPLWYANYEINCLGTWLAGYHKGDINEYELPEQILVGRSHKGTINNEDDTDEYWIIELGIPFGSLINYEGQLPPVEGNIWGINFNRCGGDVNPQYSQWRASKTARPNFHRPEDFGRLVFSGESVR